MQPETALAVGDRAPDFALPDGAGNQVSLVGHLAPRGLLLAFIHNTWCPDCMRSLRSLGRTYWFVRRLGIRLLIVARQSEESLAAYLATQPAHSPFSILADETGQVFAHYNLTAEIDVHRANATFFIDRAGIIRTMNAGLNFGLLTPFGL